MVNKKKLRVGNYVGFKNRIDIYCKVEEISIRGGVHLLRYNSEDGKIIDDQPENINDITGLTIDENWLISFGFTNINTHLSKNIWQLKTWQTEESNREILLRYHDGKWLLWEQKSNYTLYNFKNIESIHELQNRMLDDYDIELDLWQP